MPLGDAAPLNQLFAKNCENRIVKYSVSPQQAAALRKLILNPEASLKMFPEIRKSSDAAMAQ
jgi:hypothetical protein